MKIALLVIFLYDDCLKYTHFLRFHGLKVTIMLDTLARTLLAFSNGSVVIPLIILGFIWLDRNVFYHAACLVLLGIVVNVALKVTFQIPLPPALGKDWFAFPSGHMQLSTVLYVWLAYNVAKPVFRLATVALLVGIGASLIHFDYHNLFDVLAGSFFALLLIVAYYLPSKKWPQKMPLIVVLIGSLLVFYINWRYTRIPVHAWMAYYALSGFIISDKLCGRNTALLLSHKVLATFLCVLALVTVHLVFHHLLPNNPPAHIYQLEWLVIGLTVPAMVYMGRSIEKQWSSRWKIAT
ncbi:TPA: phosphatase PAP2 family protein [Legionella feeleii]|uniref:PAP2 superfamily n=1 Tax=Legionella feeleii TaxID=453 RepID=A0A0W0U8F0_9GAMM|nr:phosphatase PAP2 family protein [Legionella feeleii]KTD03948.1 PAP2 superfamily protein [Legionella feeleii]SPX61533.1 PAP2 superfamily [Legionella feeleii]